MGPDRTLSFIEVYEEDGKGEQFLESMSETTSKTKYRELRAGWQVGI